IRVLMKIARSPLAVAAALACLWILFQRTASAQDNSGSDPASALSGALSAACRANETQFANYLTADNSAAFLALPVDRRAAFLKRLALADEPGKPLLSSDAQGHNVFRCQAPEGTAEFRFGDTRVHENLAFVPVTVVDGQQTQF